MCHLVHWDRQTNCCLAVLTHPLSWRTRHFLLMRQRSEMTCLLTDLSFNCRAATCVNNFKSSLKRKLLHHVCWSLPVTVASHTSDSGFLLGLIGSLQIGFVFVFVTKCAVLVREFVVFVRRNSCCRQVTRCGTRPWLDKHPTNSRQQRGKFSTCINFIVVDDATEVQLSSLPAVAWQATGRTFIL